MNINSELMNKINELPRDIAYLAKEVILAKEKGRKVSQIEELIIGEINEILSEEGID